MTALQPATTLLVKVLEALQRLSDAAGQPLLLDALSSEVGLASARELRKLLEQIDDFDELGQPAELTFTDTTVALAEGGLTGFGISELTGVTLLQLLTAGEVLLQQDPRLPSLQSALDKLRGRLQVSTVDEPDGGDALSLCRRALRTGTSLTGTYDHTWSDVRSTDVRIAPGGLTWRWGQHFLWGTDLGTGEPGEWRVDGFAALAQGLPCDRATLAPDLRTTTVVLRVPDANAGALEAYAPTVKAVFAGVKELRFRVEPPLVPRVAHLVHVGGAGVEVVQCADPRVDLATLRHCPQVLARELLEHHGLL